jgi:hypothetical protein
MSSLTLPKSGGMRNGQLLQQPTLALPIDESDSSLLRTLPTPRAQNGEQRNMNIYARPLNQPQNLENALALLPTPTAQAAKHLLDDRGLGTPDDCNLWSVAGRLLPTPRVGGVASDRGIGSRDDTNLHAIAQRLAANGNSTNSPFDDGNTSSDDQHQTPQLWDQQADHD